MSRVGNIAPEIRGAVAELRGRSVERPYARRGAVLGEVLIDEEA